MALRLLLDYLTGRMALVNIPGTPAPVTGTNIPLALLFLSNLE